MRRNTSRARHGRIARRLMLSVVASVPLVGADWSNAQISTWTFDGNGNWTTAANWNNGVPNSTSTSAVIDDGDTAVIVNLNASQSVQNLTIGADDTLIFNDNTTLTMGGTFISNAGTIRLNSAGNLTNLSIGGGGDVTLSGGGTVILTAQNQTRVIGSNTLINQNNFITGTGQIGANTIGFTNQAGGTVNASGGALIIDPSASGVTNAGTMQANSGGALHIQGGTFNNTGGRIQALTGGEVHLLNGAFVSGGTLTAAGTGLIRTVSGHTAAIDALTSTGTINIVDNSSIQFSGAITNNSVIALQSAGNFTHAIFNAPTTLSGTGSLLLGAGAQNRVGGSSTLTLVAGHTIVGGGNLGIDSLTIVNQGLIDSNIGATMIVDPGSANGLFNTGSMQASNGVLQLTGGGGGTFNNTGGVIRAVTGGEVHLLNGALITGGSLTTTGTGVIRTLSGHTVAMNALTNSGMVVISDNSTIQFSGTIINNNVFSLQSVGNQTHAFFNSDTIMTGTGSIQLGAHPANRIGGSATLTNALGHTISGGGALGLNTLTFINQGLVDANLAATVMSVDPGSSNGLTNSGIMRASNGGVLQFTGGAGSVNNGSGTIEALNGSEVQLTGGAHITGGVISTSGTGIFRLNAGQNVGVDNLTNIGNIVVTDNADFEVSGTIINNGSINVVSVGNPTDIELQVDTIFTGTGAINLTSHPASGINGVGTLLRLSNGATHKIQGVGRIGQNDITVTNEGLIDANAGGGQALTIDPSNVADAFVNNGTMQASNASVLVLSGNGGGTFNNANGVIQALTGSEVQTTGGAQIGGGTITTAGTGIFRINASQNIGVTNVTNNGNIVVTDNADFEVSGTIANNGSINVVSVGNATDIELRADTSFSGTGAINLTSHPASGINGIAGGFRLTNLAGHTIRGYGRIGQNDIAITNQGLFDANVSGQTLTIDPAPLTNGMLNGGTMQSSSGGILLLTGNGGGTFENTGGVIQALTGSEVQMTNTAQIVGGIITTSGTGVFRANGGQNVGIADLTNNGNVVINDNTDFEVSGTIVNNGSITVTSVGSATDLELQADTTFNGTGSIVLTQLITGFNGGFRLTNGPGHTIQGVGRVGQNVTAVTNSGLIHANVANVFTIDPANVADGFLNETTGTVRASTGATMNLSGNGGGTGTGQFQNNGVFEVLDGSALQTVNSGVILNDVAGVLTGGTWRSVAATNLNLMNFLTSPAITQIAGGTTVEFSGAFSRIQFGANVPIANSLTTNNGYLKIFDGHTFNLVNSFTNGGVVELGGAGLNDGTLNSSGSITNSSTGLITGHGRVIPRPINHGTIRSSGGALVFNNGIQGGSGTVQVLGGSHLDVSAGASNSSADYLLINSTGSLSLGSNNFLVSVDYVNSNAGSGNNFNPRANVNGAGQIQASPAVSQSLTGNVTNGTTTTPTMNFGNIRVGSVSVQSYQINNVGATGPVLRGAIQTNNTAGNGGNLTDPRLTGSGVTASDFGPIANNGSASQSVTLTGLTAGALTGQAVAVENNFDNVADQLLSFTGAVYNPAVGSVSPGGIPFGNFHVGDVAAIQAITISNLAPAGSFSEDLRAINIAPTGDAQLTGPNNVGVLAGSATTSVGASISTASAGNKSGSIVMDLVSNATVNGVAIPGLSSLSLGSATVNVGATVYRFAAPLATSPVNLGQFHVGSVATGSLVVANTGPADGFTENLQAVATAFSGDILSSTGSATIAGGANSGVAMTATLSTATAGPKIGVATINLTSLAGGSGLNNTNLGAASVQVTGTAYNLAQLQLNNSSINFGIVHVGDVVSNVALSVTNGAGAGSFSENLNTTLGPATIGVVHNGGSINLLAPQANNNTNMTVGISTATKAVINGTVPVNAVSDGTGVNSLGQTNLPSQNVTVVGQVNDYADPVISKLLGSGTFGSTGVDTYSLDFGTVMVGDPISAGLQLLNDVINPADNLGGSWLASGAAYLFSNFGVFNNLAPGASITNLGVALDTSTPGTFGGSITLTPRSQNAGGYDQPLGGTVVVNITGTVEVPEPAMVLPMLAAGMLFRRRRRMK